MRGDRRLKRIQLTRGKVALVDEADHGLLARYRWYALPGATEGLWYAFRTTPTSTLLMHRVVLGLQDPETGENLAPGVEVDHRNGDGLDNRRGNLRRATRGQNGRNRRAWGRSRFLGVNRSRGRWLAQIRVDGRNRFLGRFDDEEEAARAYDRAALEHAGEYARLNFPRR